MNLVGLWLTVSLAVFSGLTMFSIYKNCDPLENGDIGTPDQVTTAVIVSSSHGHHAVCHKALLLTVKWLFFGNQMLPYLVMDILAAYPGIPGLFVAAAYSGTLR